MKRANAGTRIKRDSSETKITRRVTNQARRNETRLNIESSGAQSRGLRDRPTNRLSLFLSLSPDSFKKVRYISKSLVQRSILWAETSFLGLESQASLNCRKEFLKRDKSRFIEINGLRKLASARPSLFHDICCHWRKRFRARELQEIPLFWFGRAAPGRARSIEARFSALLRFRG